MQRTTGVIFGMQAVDLGAGPCVDAQLKPCRRTLHKEGIKGVIFADLIHYLLWLLGNARTHVPSIIRHVWPWSLI